KNKRPPEGRPTGNSRSSSSRAIAWPRRILPTLLKKATEARRLIPKATPTSPEIPSLRRADAKLGAEYSSSGAALSCLSDCKPLAQLLQFQVTPGYCNGGRLLGNLLAFGYFARNGFRTIGILHGALQLSRTRKANAVPRASR